MYEVEYIIDKNKYTVVFSNNTKAGTAIVTVLFDNDKYEGSKKVTFKINKAAGNSNYKVGTKKFTVKIKVK